MLVLWAVLVIADTPAHTQTSSSGSVGSGGDGTPCGNFTHFPRGTIGNGRSSAATYGFGNRTCGPHRTPFFPAMTVEDAIALCCNRSWAVSERKEKGINICVTIHGALLCVRVGKETRMGG